MLKPVMINRNGKIYMAVPSSVYNYFVKNNLGMEGIIILDNVYYLHMEKLSDPELQKYLLSRIKN